MLMSCSVDDLLGYLLTSAADELSRDEWTGFPCPLYIVRIKSTKLRASWVYRGISFIGIPKELATTFKSIVSPGIASHAASHLLKLRLATSLVHPRFASAVGRYIAITFTMQSVESNGTPAFPSTFSATFEINTRKKKQESNDNTGRKCTLETWEIQIEIHQGSV